MKQLLLLSALILALAVGGCSLPGGISPEVESASGTFFAMNTYLQFTAYGENADEGLSAAQARIKELEKLWSVTEEGSDIYAANHSDGTAVLLHQDTADLVGFALEMAEETDGALDPTIYPILTAWGFTTDEKRIPSRQELESLQAQVGYERVLLDGVSLTLPAQMQLDLGAVGKGFAGDLAAEVLWEYGITSALLDIGGNIQAVGSRPDGSDWRLALRNPLGEGSLGTLSVSDCAVVTSGSYENYFEQDGKRYGHILDPDTGYPVENGLLSVTVIAKQGKLCDALSTALFVMGKEQAVRYWEDHQNFEMLLVTEAGEIFLTPGIIDCFSLSGDFQTMPVYHLSQP